jgi:predicted small metal-binding protein
MGLTLACRDLGTTCPYVAHGETKEELMAAAGKHAKEVHGYTDEQLNAPEMQKKIKAAIKEA